VRESSIGQRMLRMPAQSTAAVMAWTRRTARAGVDERLGLLAASSED